LEGFLKEDGLEVEDAEEYVAMTNKIHLHIKYLDLTCRVLGGMVFLCTLPSSCKLRLRTTEGPEIAAGFHLITSWLSRHFQPAPFFHSFRICFYNQRIEGSSYIASGLRIMGFYDSELEGSHIGGQIDKAILSISVILCHDSESEGESIANLWRSFLTSLPLRNIVSLEVADDRVALPDSVWIEVFAPIKALKTIILNSEYYASFFRIASPDSGKEIALPFPALSYVTVRAPCVDDYLSIASSLDSRLEAGLGPFNLVFYTDSIKPDAITRLRKPALNVQIHPFQGNQLPRSGWSWNACQLQIGWWRVSDNCFEELRGQLATILKETYVFPTVIRPLSELDLQTSKPNYRRGIRMLPT
jgi:hypothetical protein